ncbi:MAG: mechanosensitive ion channel [Burkholderiales bacterium]
MKRLAWCTATGACLLAAGIAFAQLPALPGVPGPALAPAVAPAESVAQKREALVREIAAAQAQVDAFERNDEANRAPPGVPESEVSDRRTLARQLLAMRQQELDALERSEATERQKVAAQEEERAWAGFTTPSPQTVLVRDALRDEIEAARKRIASAATRRAMLERIAQDTERRARTTQAAARIAAEAADAARGTPQAARLDWAREIATLRAQVDVATQDRLSFGVRITREEAAAAEAALRLAERKLAEAGIGGALPPEDHARALAEIETRRLASEREAAAAEKRIGVANEALARAERRLANLRSAPEAADPEQRARDIQAAADDVALQRELLQNASITVDLLKDYGSILSGERTLWDARRELATADAFGARVAHERLAVPVAGMQARRDYIAQEMDLVAARIAELDGKRRAATGEEAARLSALLDALRAREAALREAVNRGRPLERLLARIQGDLDSRREASLTERATDAAAGAALSVRRLWNYELFTVDDTLETADGRKVSVSRSVTIGKTAGAVLIVVLGYLLVRAIMRRVERALVSRKHVPAQTAALLRNWALFVATTILVVFALASASIPITVFAFMGGALAIAAGFGLQTLLKNLVAGVILLIERPLRLGDLIEVDGQRGRVTEIGIRASTLRTADGIESLIPNSAFLEGRLVNWTYSDTRNRQTILVGVAYGTPLRRAGDILEDILKRHGRVLQDPAPQVYLDDYGDSAVRFALTYWVEMVEGNDVRRLKSDILHMIDSAFAEAGIAMPFPQRDVHLDAKGPLRVEVVPPPAAGPAGG